MWLCVTAERGRAASFAATIDPAASDVTRHSVEAVTAWFGEDVVRLAEGEQTADAGVYRFLIRRAS